MQRFLLYVLLVLTVVSMTMAKPANNSSFWWGIQLRRITLEEFLNREYPNNWTPWFCSSVPGGVGVSVVNHEDVTDKNILFHGELLPGSDIRHMFLPWDATIYDVTFRVLHWDEWQRLQERLELRTHPKGPVNNTFDPEGVYLNGSLDR